MKTIKLISIFIIALFPALLVASATASKPSVKVVRNTPYSFFERYHLSDDTTIDVCDKATSVQGEFQTVSGVTLGTVAKSLIATLSGPGPHVGGVNESVRVPYSVMKKAQQLGLSAFLYNRSFSFTGPSCNTNNAPISINIKMTGASSVALHVSRIQLYFINKRADITVDKNQNLPLSVDLKIYGKGLLKGYWEVDGRILSGVYKQINFGKSITLKVPKVPGLPTYETGTHRVRFVVTSPEPSISLPQAIYFVKEQPSIVSSTINLISPKNGDILNGDVWEFTWKPILKTDTYLIEFYKKGGDKPMFSALSKSPAYTVPGYIMKKIFNMSGIYSWKVTGYNSLSNQIGNSETRDFLVN
ncbi:MAG: hypothetical protein QM482_02415 [Sulfurospirillum sp.]